MKKLFIVSSFLLLLCTTSFGQVVQKKIVQKKITTTSPADTLKKQPVLNLRNPAYKTKILSPSTDSADKHYDLTKNKKS